MPSEVDVPEDRKFIGFDAYKRRWTACKPGDVAIFATPPAFRWVHFTYAIEKGLNVFMEKPVTVDGPTSRKMLELAEESEKKNLKVGVGLMCRHCKARGELFDRIQNGEIGDITMLRAYRMHPPVGSAFTKPKPADDQRADVADQELPQLPVGQRRLLQRLLHPQHRRMLLDEERLAGAGPGLRRPALSRRQHRPELRQLLRRIHVRRRHQAVARRPRDDRLPPGIRQLRPRHQGLGRSSRLVGHSPAKCRIFSDQNIKPRGGDVVWAFPQPEPNPYQLEWDDLIDAIRQDKPYNEVEARRRSQPGDLDGPHGRPHRPGRHLRRHAQLRRTSSRPTSTS